MCCLLAHHSIPSFNLTGFILCMCVRIFFFSFFFALCLSGLYYIIICKCTTAFQMCTEAEVVLCIVCFAFPFLPYYFFHSVSPLSPWSLAWSHLTSCCTHRNTHWQNESLATSSQSQHFVLPSVVILPFNLSPCPYHAHFFFPLTTFSFSITLSRPLITVPMFSLIIFIYSLPPSPPISVCEAGWLWMLTWEGLTFRGRSPACSTDISARLWWCLWTEMCGGKSCLSPCLPAALTLRLHQLEWDVL